jgi:hypothetical protein
MRFIYKSSEIVVIAKERTSPLDDSDLLSFA